MGTCAATDEVDRGLSAAEKPPKRTKRRQP
jgi:hypothetical protein